MSSGIFCVKGFFNVKHKKSIESIKAQVKNFGFFFSKFLQSFRQIPWIFKFISPIFLKFLGQNSIFPPGILVTKICKNLDFIPEQKSILENSRNSLIKQMKKADSIGKNIFLKIHQKFHEFSGKKNQPGIRKKRPDNFYKETSR